MLHTVLIALVVSLPPQAPTPPQAPALADPCKACKARVCGDDVCRRSDCEVGRCLTLDPARCLWVADPWGDFALKHDGKHVGSYRVGKGYRGLSGDDWGPYQDPPVPFAVPAHAATVRVVEPVFVAPPMMFAAPAFGGDCGPQG